ncbi:histidine kinase [Chitinophaga niastensis]|uniref:Histidine kinase n=1 Tax=Chitinophaga niastensis TaxID=536980 RepID=A0A2P8HDW9_CHINA|nr:histidine kinase [Chitinophaga niastensis]PSL44341.1 histidine kinase [Chitinophaga niastensis]
MGPLFTRRNNLLLTLAFIWVLATIAFVIRWYFFPEFGRQLFLISYIFSLIYLPLFFYALQWINHLMNKVMPYETWGMKRFIIQNLLFIGFGIVMMKFLNLQLKLPVYNHLVNDNTQMLMSDKIYKAFTYYSYGALVSILNLAFYARYLFRNWQSTLIEKTRLQVQAARLEQEKTTVQYENLKNQLNPHFLFNSFTSLNSLITKDPFLAQRFLQQLSKVYRHILQSGSNALVSLQEEITFVNNYIALQTTRFQQGLEVMIIIPEQYLQRSIVPVTLQVLVENAIKHNIIDAEQPLIIKINVEESIYLVIENNIQMKTNVEYSNKQGLNNLKNLYAYYSHQPVVINTADNIFSVKIPLL